MLETSELLTVTQAAEEIGVTVGCIRKMLKEGRAEGMKVGPRCWLLTIAEVERVRSTRKPNESIVIGDDIEIMVVRMLPDRVKIGIKAPDNVAVHRKEVAQAIARKLKHGDIQK